VDFGFVLGKIQKKKKMLIINLIAETVTFVLTQRTFESGALISCKVFVKSPLTCTNNPEESSE